MWIKKGRTTRKSKPTKGCCAWPLLNTLPHKLTPVWVKPTRQTQSCTFLLIGPRCPDSSSTVTSLRLFMESWKWKKLAQVVFLTCSELQTRAFNPPSWAGLCFQPLSPLYTLCQELRSGISILPSPATSLLMLISQLFLTLQPDHLNSETAASSPTSALLFCFYQFGGFFTVFTGFPYWPFLLFSDSTAHISRHKICLMNTSRVKS